MKTSNPHHYRQGDVLIERIAHIPSLAAKQAPAARIILAQGEVTGHYHALEVESPADWFQIGTLSTAAKKSNTPAGETYVSLPAGGRVTHPEHAVIHLPPGAYRVTRQREYAPDANRNVAD